MATIKGGEKAQREIRRIALLLRNPGVLKVGFLENARYPDGKPVAMIAAIQNFGAPRAGIPPRPFFSNMIKQKSAEWPKAMARLLKSEKYNAEKVLKLTGEGIKGQLQQSIRDTNAPPLAASTIKRKGFAKPLILTGQMLQSVDYEVSTT